MKYLRNILVERRNFRDYAKYTDTICRKLEKYIRIEKLVLSEENGSITLYIKTWGKVYNNFFEFIYREVGRLDYVIMPANGSQLHIEIYDIPKKFLEELDFEIVKRKFNV